MIKPCEHQFAGLDNIQYVICKKCGSYKSEIPFSSELYLNNYWSHENGRSTLDEQIYNVDIYDVNGVTKNQKVLELCNSGGKRVLEIGCAPGILLDKLTSLYDEVDGIEVDSKYETKIRELAPNLHQLMFGFFPAVTEGIQAAYYDTIIALDVFEHVEDGKLFIDECFRLLKPGGTLLLMLPLTYGESFDRFAIPEEHLWIYSLQGISGLLHEFEKLIYDRWTNGHEIVVAMKGK